MSNGLRAAVERAWQSPDEARALRTLLRPLSWVYGVGAAAVDVAWSTGVRPSIAPALPTVSVGNLSVGGTGKTPVASWLAQWFLARGIRPAIVLRGYGDDEPLVHARLAPQAIVVASPDRVAGIRDAAARGAQVAILDDGFQHRRVRRAVDLVLLSAEQVAAECAPDGVWRPVVLPAGPYRESIRALQRASALVLTRKDGDAAQMAMARQGVTRATGVAPLLEIALTPGGLVAVGGTGGVPSLTGTRLLAVAGIGAPERFAAQLRQAGAQVTLRAFPDHHAFDAADVSRLVTAARDYDGVVCTLKDAVKLAPLWPASGSSLSYLSQECRIEAGGDQLSALLAPLLAMVPS